MNLHRKAQFTTGSTGGKGFAIVRALAQVGRSIMRSGFGGTKKIKTLWCSLREDSGTRVGHAGADMHNPAAINAMVEAARRAFATVDVLIDNAGVKIAAPAYLRPIGKGDAIIAIGLSAAFHALHSVSSRMTNQACGRIVNIASAHGSVAIPFKPAYADAGHGIVGQAKIVALDTAEQAGPCSVICPN